VPDTCNYSTYAGGDDAVADARKIDPFDVEALEKSLNDSATRVSAIWVSFLIFSLYLLTAATTVTHRQLFLAEPVKLPVLNIDLPLWGFFWLAPTLFVIFHAYVLIQLILLARTAAAYDAAVTKLAEQDNLSAEANASLRQRLANTLFAQILAGSPREREGWFGSLLKAMAWITLVIAPILILLTFQFMFLPYHSHLATWTHRLLILLELVVAFQLWPLVLNPQRDFQWPNWRWRIRERTVAARNSFQSSQARQRARQSLRQQRAALMATAMFILVSLSLAAFPGEPHVNLFTGQTLSFVQCNRWFSEKFDRLILPGVDVVDDEKLAKIAQHTSDRKLTPYEGERTQNFRDRDLNCIDLTGADLRRVDLTSALLWNANLEAAALEGASLNGASMRNAKLDFADLRAAALNNVRLQGGSLRSAKLQRATLDDAQLQGASFAQAQLQGAFLISSQLQGASFRRAQLHGAVLVGANLQLASFVETELQGASLWEAQVHGAFLGRTHLQGAIFLVKAATYADLAGAYVWHAQTGTCEGAHVRGSNFDPIIAAKTDIDQGTEPIEATSQEITKFIDISIKDIPDVNDKEDVKKYLRERLAPDLTEKGTKIIAWTWSECERASRTKSQEVFDNERAAYVRDFACIARDGGEAIIYGTIQNLTSGDLGDPDFSLLLARLLYSLNGESCPTMKKMEKLLKELLRDFIAKSAKEKTTTQ
jgi:uncharacterized protein YjbI with pentapeptide repeats